MLASVNARLAGLVALMAVGSPAPGLCCPDRSRRPGGERSAATSAARRDLQAAPTLAARCQRARSGRTRRTAAAEALTAPVGHPTRFARQPSARNPNSPAAAGPSPAERRAEIEKLYPPLPPVTPPVAILPGPSGAPLSLADLQQFAAVHSPVLRPSCGRRSIGPGGDDPGRRPSQPAFRRPKPITSAPATRPVTRGSTFPRRFPPAASCNWPGRRPKWICKTRATGPAAPATICSPRSAAIISACWWPRRQSASTAR